MSYRDYMFQETTKEFIRLEGFEEPTPIQKEILPLACKGRDVIGISATGSGKTHAFLIPIMEKVDVHQDHIQAVITAPTRELALQLYSRMTNMQKANPELKIRLITGGMEKTRMNETLKVQPHIVIGTPGRIKDLFLNDKTLRVEGADILVIDEADMTLEFGFLEEVDAIAGRMKKSLQMMSFSATMPNALKQFLKKYMHQPATIHVEDAKSFHPNIEHVLVPCTPLSYEQKLLEILPSFTPYVCLIFANTRELAANVAASMRDAGYPLIELHGDLSSRERTKAMKELEHIQKPYVVATDIAARGIDIEGISHVISLGFPKELDYYIHRSGRTGRAGKDGICYALYQKQDDAVIRQLEKRGIHFEHRSYKNGNWNELEALHKKKIKQDDPLEKEISKIVAKKKKQVKPGYKVKRKQEVEKLKRKAKRTMIQEDIKRQKKERAKSKQAEKRRESE
ncbi:DEAD/DEAH box helicase [[Eubacterium] hominis]|uniref:DEAD/DEAH box helicase n=1 Tax=[Eubacterium] hominis TaxID=2764325 RepID=UPI003A4D70A5